MDAQQFDLVVPTDSADRLPWTKPEVRRLVVTVDTRMPPAKGGSFVDGGLGNQFPAG